MNKELPRIVLSVIIVLYFGYAMLNHWSSGLEETLQNIIMIVIGYWLGSSKGSTDKTELMK